MSRRSVIVIGAGGHAMVVADALLAEGRRVLGFSDAAPAGKAAPLPGLEIIVGDDDLDPDGDYDLANGIGGTGDGGRGLRRAVQTRLEERGFRFTGARHASAVISPHADLAADVQVMAGAVVQAGARIGAGSIVNTGAIIEHGCDVGAFVHCASGSVLCGDVHIGDGGHVGAGAVVRQGVRLEAGVVVGAGAVVVDAGSGPGALIGAPARRREMR